MKISNKPEYPREFVLIAENEEEEIIVEALRISGTSAIEVHKIYEDDVYEELVQTPAFMAAMAEYLDRNESMRSCPNCNVNRDTHRIEICQEHRTPWELEFLKKMVALKLKVPCTCGLIEPDMPSYDPKTGHSKYCLVPALEKVQGKIPS